MKKILIIGESCRDIFIYCDTQRLAPDIPVPVLKVRKKTQNPGMARNVERNVKALHKLCDIVTNNNWRAITKTRFMHEKTPQAFFRVDTENRMPRADVRKIPLKKYDIIGVSDYNKGFLTKEDIRYVCEHHPCVFVDTKKPVGRFLEGAKYIKINKFEYEHSLPIPRDIGRKIICTRGGGGVSFRGKTYPVSLVEVKDVAGAGDSFFAALLVRYAETQNIEEAIVFANLCASQVVKKKGVSVITRPKASANSAKQN
ncbi:MAG: PfkB family carbohydrate kinase [bacterium]|nr:PfkB family carbohydrate kinase [bacterium]